MFNLNQVQELLASIDKMQLVFIGQELGVDVLTEEEKQVLERFGVLKSIKPTGKIDDMFRLGMLVEALGQDSVRNAPFSKLKKLLSSGKLLPLTNSEKAALAAVKFQAYNDIKGLGNRVSRDFSQIFIEADQRLRSAYENTIKTEAEQAVVLRKTTRELASALRHKTKDWARDFDRIADFIMHSALDMGISQQILRTHGESAEVYKDVYPGACDECIKAYLTGGIGSRPKIFRIKDILGNATNIGRKQKDWLPVIGSHHPFCRCTIQFLPLNSVWNDEDRNFELKREDLGVKRISKPKIYVEF